MTTPLTFAKDYILRWEDGGSANPDRTHSLDPVDAGNWSSGKAGVGVLIGSNHGVTAAALASYRKVPVTDITKAVMRALTLEEAAQIALKAYYQSNRLDRLPWNAVTASIMDFGWGAGPIRTVQKMQAMVGVASDGEIGLGTIAAYTKWLAGRTLAEAAEEWAKVRNAYYHAIIANRPANAKYRNGWRNRTDYFTPGHKEGWWSRFNA